MKLLVEDDPALARYSAEQLIGARGRMTRVRDDFAAAEITSVEDIRDRFCTPFAWGCEADDPLVGIAFDQRVSPLGALVPAFFASDLGHWDVPEFDEPLEEAFELVERGILDADQLRDFLFVQSGALLWLAQPGLLRGHRDRGGAERALSVAAHDRSDEREGEQWPVGWTARWRSSPGADRAAPRRALGIGQAIAISLAREGASVVVVDKVRRARRGHAARHRAGRRARRRRGGRRHERGRLRGDGAGRARALRRPRHPREQRGDLAPRRRSPRPRSSSTRRSSA